jgi:hypothetical protein
VQNRPTSAVDPSGLSSTHISLPANVAAALEAGQYNHAIWLLSVGAARGHFARLVSLVLANPGLIAQLQSAVTEVPLQPSGTRMCGYTAYKLWGVLSGEHELGAVKVFLVLPRPGDMIRATVRGRSVEWTHHYYIRIGDTILDSTTIDIPQAARPRTEWLKQFDLGKHGPFGLFKNKNLRDRYDVQDVTERFQTGNLKGLIGID